MFKRRQSGYSTSIQHLFFGTRLYNRRTMKYIKSTDAFEKSDKAQFRLKVIEFHKKHGTAATKDAFSVSKPTIYRWRKLLKESGGRLESLVALSKAPKKRRVMMTDPKIIAFIRDLRETHNRIGKEKIKPLLDEYCQREAIKAISESTIGKIIKRHNLYYQRSRRIYHNPSSKQAQKKVRYREKIRYSPKVEEIGYIEIDTVVKFIDGMRVYILNAVDIKLKFQFSYGYTSLSSKTALDFFKKLEMVYPISGGIRVVQTDNGLEFLGVFDDYLKLKGIKHLFIYPRCPKINAFVERANRTLQEEFVDGALDYLSIGIHEFNKHLIEYLIWYNTKRVHKTLGNISPIDYLLKISPESQMYVTYTFA